MAPPSLNCCTMYGVLRNDNTAQAWLISNDPYIYTPHLLLLAPTPTTTPTTHQPTPMRFPRPLWPLCFFLSTTPRSPGPVRDRFTLPAVCCFVCAVCSACGMVWTSHPPSSVGRSCVCPCRSPNSWALLWLGAAFGGLALRASENYKLQITNYITETTLQNRTRKT